MSYDFAAGQVFARTPIGWYWGTVVETSDDGVLVQFPQNPFPIRFLPQSVRTMEEHAPHCVDLWTRSTRPSDLELCAGTLTFQVPRALMGLSEARDVLSLLPNPRAGWAETHIDGYWCWTSHGEMSQDFKSGDDEGWWVFLTNMRTVYTKRLRRRMSRPAGKVLRG